MLHRLPEALSRKREFEASVLEDFAAVGMLEDVTHYIAHMRGEIRLLRLR